MLFPPVGTRYCGPAQKACGAVFGVYVFDLCLFKPRSPIFVNAWPVRMLWLSTIASIGSVDFLCLSLATKFNSRLRRSK